MSGGNRMTTLPGTMSELFWFWGVVTCVKVLLIPAYFSTDFEVHRHWLALTSALPLAKWYADESSPWTLDYPPLFAYFERFLAFLAARVDPSIVRLDSPKDYASPAAVIFLRLSVSAIADIALLLAAFFLTRRKALDPLRRRMTLVLLLWSPALLIVDHVHFQYNGYLLGFLLISLSLLEEGKDLAGGIAFAVLICSKHLFMVAAPVYFVYLLRHYCIGGVWKGAGRFLIMGMAVGTVFAIAFGPFLYYGQIEQVIHRLFPFGRGLCHAYWAPNFWVFYIVLDKVLALAFSKLGLSVSVSKASFTGGLVGDASDFTVLPQVTPVITFLLVFASISPCLVKAFRNPQPKHIMRWVAYAYTCGFMFGWHVHEKASLHFLMPLGLIAMNSFEDARHYFLLSIVSCYSMFPLLFEPQEYLIKLLLLVTFSFLLWTGFTSYFSYSSTAGFNHKVSGALDVKNGFVGDVGSLYLLGLIGVEIWGQLLHPYIFGNKLPFLPLMLISIYCAVGMMWSWVWQLRQIIRYS